MPGFPIRTSSDPRSVGSSPRHIAASYVLHRLSMPRHPPCALKHLQNTQTKKQKLQKQTRHKALLARCSQPLSTKQTPHPTTKMERQHTHPTKGRQTACCLRTQQCAQHAPADTTPEEVAPVDDQSCCCVKTICTTSNPLQAPAKNIPTIINPALVTGTGEKWCSLERR